MAEFQIRGMHAPMKARFNFWKLALPLATGLASFILIGCASKAIKQDEEVSRMGSGKYAVAKESSVESAKPDTLKFTPVKTRESLLKEELQRLKDELIREYKTLPMPERGVQSASPERIKELSVFVLYNTTEQMIYKSAIEGNTADVEKYVNEILKLAESRGEISKVEEIVKNFRAIWEMK